MIRDAVLNDYDELHRLFVEENRYTYSIAPDKTVLTDEVLSRDELDHIIGNDQRLLAVCESDHGLSGLVFAKHHKEAESRWSPEVNSVYIEILFVSDHMRGQGVGTKLLSYTKQWSHTVGASSLELDVWNESSAAIRLYERTGMKERRKYMTMALS